MRTLYVASAAVGLSLAACGDYDRNEAAYNADEANYAEGAGGTNYSAETAAAGASWPEGSRIVVEEGVTYRIMPGGERIVLGPDDSRIEVIEGVRYRIDPNGTRVRIDEEGAVIAIDDDGVSATVNTQ